MFPKHCSGDHKGIQKYQIFIKKKLRFKTYLAVVAERSKTQIKVKNTVFKPQVQIPLGTYMPFLEVSHYGARGFNT